MESPWNAVPSENITLLQRGFLQELQGDLCPTMDLPGLQGHGCLTVFCTMAYRGVSAPAPGTPAAPPFSLLWSLQSWFSLIFHCSSRGSEAFFPFWKLLSRRWHSLGCCAQLCLAGLLALAGTDFIQLYPVQWPPLPSPPPAAPSLAPSMALQTPDNRVPLDSNSLSWDHSRD